jgi:flagellar basal-body rod protein FlgF
MADGIYVSMCGAAARTEQLDSIADNLANTQTPGFKASRPSFEAFLARSGAADKTYPASVATRFDLRAGPTTQTGNALDVVPDDGAFLAVQTASGPAYTRDGRLALDGQGRLVRDGRPVLDRGGAPISVPPGTRPQIDPDGTVHAGDAIVGQLATFTLSGEVNRVGPSLFAPGPRGASQQIAVQVRTGELETGGASPLAGMVQLISSQRSFDASMQALQTYRSMDSRGNDLGRVR